MKVGKDLAHDKAVYTWFVQQWSLGNIVTRAMLRSKAIQYYKYIPYEKDKVAASL